MAQQDRFERSNINPRIQTNADILIFLLQQGFDQSSNILLNKGLTFAKTNELWTLKFGLIMGY